MIDELTKLTSERQRVVSQIAELRRSEKAIRQSLHANYNPGLDSLITVYDRRTALEEYLRQIDGDLVALRDDELTFSSFKPAMPGRR